MAIQTLEQVKEVIATHKLEKCFNCNTMVEKADGSYHCNKCGLDWANLFIKRLPAQTFLTFKEYADKYFCSDYGFALKELVDSKDRYTAILNLIQEHEDRINKLEFQPTKQITTLSGRRIGGIDNG